MQTAFGRWLVAFRYKDFRLLWIGESISALGTEMFYVALSWQLYLITHSAAALGLIGVVQVLPVICFSLLGGTVADVYNRKKILYVTQPIIMLCSALLAVATFTHAITPLLVYLLVGLVAAVVAFDLPARGAMLPNLVSKEDLANANAVYEMLWQIASIVGPALAGFLIASIGVGGVYSLDSFSTLAVILALLLMRHSGEPVNEDREDGEGIRKTRATLVSIKEGLAFVRSKPILWSTILLDFFGTLLASATVLLPIYARDILHVGPQGLGLLYAAPSIGALLTGLLVARIGQKFESSGRVLLLAVAAYALATMLFGLSHLYLLSLFALALVGGSDSISVIIRSTIRQLATPDSLRGRLSSITMIFWMGGPQLGEFEAGMLAALIGAPLAVFIGGVATLVLVGLMALTIPALRNYKSTASE